MHLHWRWIYQLVCFVEYRVCFRTSVSICQLPSPPTVPSRGISSVGCAVLALVRWSNTGIPRCSIYATTIAFTLFDPLRCPNSCWNCFSAVQSSTLPIRTSTNSIPMHSIDLYKLAATRRKQGQSIAFCVYQCHCQTCTAGHGRCATTCMSAEIPSPHTSGNMDDESISDADTSEDKTLRRRMCSTEPWSGICSNSHLQQQPCGPQERCIATRVLRNTLEYTPVLRIVLSLYPTPSWC